MGYLIQGTVIVEGIAEGSALVTDEPLSFWGGYDHQTGEITDRRHPLSGQNAAGQILVMPFTRGSSTTTAVLLEAIKKGTAPVAIITNSVDSFFALASIVAKEMYAKPLPILAIEAEASSLLQTGDRLTIMAGGLIQVETNSPI
jgi:hypothetical protein